MNEITALTLQAMQHDAARLERVAANLANALTPGYKREVMVQRAAGAAPASFAEEIERHSATAQTGVEAAPSMQVLRDMRTGTLKTTGQSLDVALAGRGFFEVATPHGPAYTRHGQFQLDARGRLITAQGHAVMGTGGEIALSGAAASIDATGAITQGGREVGRLSVVDFEDSTGLQPVDGGLFLSGDRPARLAGDEIQVRQGFLENANISTMHEMVELMRTMRHFESMNRVMQSYDDMLGSAIRKLGEP